MKNLLVTLMIAFVLFTSSPAEALRKAIIQKIWDEVADYSAEALRASVIRKIWDKVVDLLKERQTVKKKSGDEGGNIYNVGEEGARIIYDLGEQEKKRLSMEERGRRPDEDGARKRLESNRDEEKKGAGVPFWNGDKHLSFSSKRSAREAVKCQDGNPKMVIGYGASVYERPDLESSILGKYEPNERVCVTSQTLGWKMTLFGWLEEKSIF